jgi:glycine/D-amino acid oxidase-like deaminating enzyme
VVRELASRAELPDLPEPVIVNCTGLGAKALFGDEELEPVKGQLTFLLPQPEVDYMVITDGLYMFPRRDGILLGGTFEHGAWSLDVDEPARRRIVDGHRALFDGMR